MLNWRGAFGEHWTFDYALETRCLCIKLLNVQDWSLPLLVTVVLIMRQKFISFDAALGPLLLVLFLKMVEIF